MAGATTFLQHLGIYASAIVADAQTKRLLIVSDLGFNASSLRVSKSVAENFKSNTTDLVSSSRR
jgi:hypothetical protein